MAQILLTYGEPKMRCPRHARRDSHHSEENMSGDIFFGFDKSQPEGQRRNDGYVNSATFDAFGDLLDAALEGNYDEILCAIKEGEAMSMYCMDELPAGDYNAVIHAMRAHIASLTNPNDWQQKGMWVWREMAEPFIRKDERYDFAFHQEVPLQENAEALPSVFKSTT